MKTILSTAILCALAGTAQAADDADKGFYFGAGGGTQNMEVSQIAFDADATTWKLFAGYQINRNLALEAAYVDGGKASQQYGDLTASVANNTIQASAIGSFWFNDYAHIFTRVAANHFDTHGNLTDGITTIDIMDSGTEFGFGAGIGALWDNALFRLEYEQVDFSDVDSQLISLSIAWRL